MNTGHALTTLQDETKEGMLTLPCGHPGEPNNLIDGKCGTCFKADEWKRRADTFVTSAAKEVALTVANNFRCGKLTYDSSGPSTAAELLDD